MTIEYRPAVPDDAVGITRVQFDTWRATYAGIVPADVLDNLNYERRAEFWKRDLADPAQPAFVAVDGDRGTIVAFVSGGVQRDTNLAEYDGELYAIYVLPGSQKGGIGRTLMEMLARRLYTLGYRALLLWVLKENIPSRVFYERMGGRYVTEKTIHIGADLLEVAYGWLDLTTVFEAK